MSIKKLLFLFLTIALASASAQADQLRVGVEGATGRIDPPGNQIPKCLRVTPYCSEH